MKLEGQIECALIMLQPLSKPTTAGTEEALFVVSLS